MLIYGEIKEAFRGYYMLQVVYYLSKLKKKYSSNEPAIAKLV